jgi:hypothetical protein
MVTVLLSNQAFTSPNPPDLCRDFWTGVYQAIEE